MLAILFRLRLFAIARGSTVTYNLRMPKADLRDFDYEKVARLDTEILASSPLRRPKIGRIIELLDLKGGRYGNIFRCSRYGQGYDG